METLLFRRAVLNGLFAGGVGGTIAVLSAYLQDPILSVIAFGIFFYGFPILLGAYFLGIGTLVIAPMMPDRATFFATCIALGIGLPLLMQLGLHLAFGLTFEPLLPHLVWRGLLAGGVAGLVLAKLSWTEDD